MRKATSGTVDYLWSGGNKTTVEPGETAKVELGTAADNLFVVHQLDKSSFNGQTSTANYSFITLNKEKKTFPSLLRKQTVVAMASAGYSSSITVFTS